ncbi:MAG TPA: CRISPR-associated endonuclease Cas6 [Paludibacteraceae bacterium]|jgi:hypothetical protein|nr:hypothetical protein [Paludibacteraceae bacterium]MBP8967014.1 hypothetical protein [Paludibacteraceae bacterium]HOF99281.1 CRISPR-associated endonuclease Cas6 [Paludibacteraceae bacterium]HOJ66766.1 CRISPR-associated endonuclease Cas6 [Paludibacteraceae bacterium]HOR38328.1 CRISPR-associated endonuclease Cas6 [Paludibacteraceae bacterium]
MLIRFENSIQQQEIEYFRGAVIHLIPSSEILFHNHLQDGFRFSYPLIQYKRIANKAAIMCFNEGTESIGSLLANHNHDIQIGDRIEKLEIAKVQAFDYQIQIWEPMFRYHIRKWLPFNQKNFEDYNRLESIAEKCLFLENILTGNLLSFAKGLHIFFDKQVVCKILQLENSTLTTYKGIKMNQFDAVFSCNVSIPDFTGLGKGVSIGYGMVTKYKNNTKN